MAEIERAVKEIWIDADLQKNVEALATEGWQLDPENPPKCVYHVMRIVGQQPSEGDMQLRLQIDDSKIGILRDGKIVE
jgi:hypothetical protein